MCVGSECVKWRENEYNKFVACLMGFVFFVFFSIFSRAFGQYAARVYVCVSRFDYCDLHYAYAPQQWCH